MSANASWLRPLAFRRLRRFRPSRRCRSPSTGRYPAGCYCSIYRPISSAPSRPSPGYVTVGAPLGAAQVKWGRHTSGDVRPRVQLDDRRRRRPGAAHQTAGPSRPGPAGCRRPRTRAAPRASRRPPELHAYLGDRRRTPHRRFGAVVIADDQRSGSSDLGSDSAAAVASQRPQPLELLDDRLAMSLQGSILLLLRMRASDAVGPASSTRPRRTPSACGATGCFDPGHRSGARGAVWSTGSPSTHFAVRLFVAVCGLPTRCARSSSSSNGPLLRGVRWTAAAQWHVTLAFLGEVDDPWRARLADALASRPAPRRPPTAELGPDTELLGPAGAQRARHRPRRFGERRSDMHGVRRPSLRWAESRRLLASRPVAPPRRRPASPLPAAGRRPGSRRST